MTTDRSGGASQPHDHFWKSSVFAVQPLVLSVLLGFFCPLKHNDILYNILFYLFFVCWIFRYVPQISLNRTRQSTIGLAPDATLLFLVANAALVIHFTCFSYFGFPLKLTPLIFAQNDQILGSIFVYGNFVLNFILAIQTLSLNGGWKKHRPSNSTIAIVCVLGIGTAAGLPLLKYILYQAINFDEVFDKWQLALVCLYYIFSFARLLPQIQHNTRRKSVVGFSIVYAFLDFIGAAALCALLFFYSASALSKINVLRYTSLETKSYVMLLLSLLISLFDLIALFQCCALKNKDDHPSLFNHSAPHPISDSGAHLSLNIEDIGLQQAVNASLSENAPAFEEQLQPVRSPVRTNMNEFISWSCVRCTNINDLNLDFCEICRLPREKSIQPSSRTQDEMLLFGR